MVQKSNRRSVHDLRAMKARGQKISMLYVTSLEEAAAADAAGIDMLSIEARYFSAEMREAAGKRFVQVGLPFGPFGSNVTAEDYCAPPSNTPRWAATAFTAPHPWISRKSCVTTTCPSWRRSV